MSRAAIALLLTLVLAAPAAAEPPKTGFEQRDGASWTTHEEEVAFLQAVAAGSPRVALSEIGRTKQNRPLHLVEIGAPGPVGRDASLSRPTVLTVCSQHGNEPSGREACLRTLRDLAFSTDAATVALLEKTTFLFVPAANPDGRDANDRENADGVDINRDHLGLDTPEARAMAQVVLDWAPDVALDLHEYGPSQPVLYDDSLLWLWPRNLNTDKAVHDLAKDVLGKGYLVPAAQAAGYSIDEYGQAEVADNDIQQTAGDADEGIMRNAMGLRHVLGILVETRVDADVRQSPFELVETARVQRRRVDSHMAILGGLRAFMADHGADAMRVTAEAADRKALEGANRSAPVFFDGADNQEPTAAKTVNPPPCGYGLTAQQVSELGPRLGLHGIGLSTFNGSPFVSMAQAAEPVIPLLLDGRGRADRRRASATPLDACPAVAPQMRTAPPAAGPIVPEEMRCVARRTVLLARPRPKGRVLRTVVKANGRRVRFRRGVAAIPPGRPGTTIRVVFTQTVERNGRTRTVRTVRRLKVCKT